MNLLVTNDDGFQAPGIQMLASIAANVGNVTIVAPSSEQSGISHKITFEKPLGLNQMGENAYTVDGTPADCVRVALSLWNGQFDFVLSGINDGANLGVDVYYSGTVAAAREATFFGVPAIAFSQYRANYAAAKSYDVQNTRPLVSELLSDWLQQPKQDSVVTNINLPDRAASGQLGEIQRKTCAVDPSPLLADYKTTENGLLHTATYADRPRKPGMDTDICFGGDVSISELRF